MGDVVIHSPWAIGGSGGGGSSTVRFTRTYYIGSPIPSGLQNAFVSYAALKSYWDSNPDSAPSRLSPAQIYLLPGYYNEQIILPDYTALRGIGRVIIGGDDVSSHETVLEIGQGCEVWNVCVTPALADKKTGILVRDATCACSTTGPFNLNGLTLIVNGVSEDPLDDVTITFSGNNLVAENVAFQINSQSGGTVYALGLNSKVYLWAVNNNPINEDSLIIRKEGTANSVLGFSTTADTKKQRSANATVFIGDCTIVGYTTYSLVNNGHGWLYAGVIFADKAPFGTIMKDTAIEGNHPTVPSNGVLFVGSSPLLYGCSISNIKGGGAGMYIFDFPFYGIPVLAMVGCYLNDYDIRADGHDDLSRTVMLWSTGINVADLHPDSTVGLNTYVYNSPIGISCGGIQGIDVNYSISILGAGEDYRVQLDGNCFTENLKSFSKVVPDYTTGLIEVGPGVYEVNASLVVSSEDTFTLTFDVRDGVASRRGTSSVKIKGTSGDPDVVTLSVSTIIDIHDIRNISLFVLSDSACDLTVKSVSFVVRETEPGIKSLSSGE